MKLRSPSTRSQTKGVYEIIKVTFFFYLHSSIVIVPPLLRASHRMNFTVDFRLFLLQLVSNNPNSFSEKEQGNEFVLTSCLHWSLVCAAVIGQHRTNEGEPPGLLVDDHVILCPWCSFTSSKNLLLNPYGHQGSIRMVRWTPLVHPLLQGPHRKPLEQKLWPQMTAITR